MPLSAGPRVLCSAMASLERVLPATATATRLPSTAVVATTAAVRLPSVMLPLLSVSGLRKALPGGRDSKRRGAARHVDDHALARQLRRRAVGAAELARAVLQQLEPVVGALGLVVEEHEPMRADGAAVGDRVVDARVSPADLRAVLVFEVLRVVEQDVGAAGERAARDPVGRSSLDAGQRRLVIREVGDARPAGLEAEADGRARMQHEVRSERDAARSATARRAGRGR